jgi:hypothetical protein
LVTQRFAAFYVSGIVGTEKNHFVKKQWPKRENLTPGKKNVTCKTLVDPKKMYLPPLHIKLDLMKKFVKAMDRDDQVFFICRESLQGLAMQKSKKGCLLDHKLGS